MRFTLPLFLVFALWGCSSTPDSIPEDLGAHEYFQKAQEALVEFNDYSTALLYYETFLERFPTDLQKIVEAEYEIGFIHYKMGDTERASLLFNNLLDRYKAEGSEVLPRWPQTLAEKVLSNIEGESEEPESTTAEE